jgi:hypothetical protein
MERLALAAIGGLVALGCGGGAEPTVGASSDAAPVIEPAPVPDSAAAPARDAAPRLDSMESAGEIFLTRHLEPLATRGALEAVFGAIPAPSPADGRCAAPPPRGGDRDVGELVVNGGDGRGQGIIVRPAPDRRYVTHLEGDVLSGSLAISWQGRVRAELTWPTPLDRASVTVARVDANLEIRWKSADAIAVVRIGDLECRFDGESGRAVIAAPGGTIAFGLERRAAFPEAIVRYVDVVELAVPPS